MQLKMVRQADAKGSVKYVIETARIIMQKARFRVEINLRVFVDVCANVWPPEIVRFKEVK